MCLSDKETRTNITAVDLDLPPYSAPFHYELLGDVKGKWRIEPKHGTTVNLIREKNVYSGHYEFQVKISDNQGIGSVQNLSITVCDCIIEPNCQGRRYMTARPSLGAIGIIIFALLFLLAFLLMAFLISCKQKKIMIPTDDVPDWYLIKSNTETPGTDCKLPAKIAQMDMSEHSVKTFNSLRAQNGISSQESVLHNGFYQGFSASTEQQMIRRSLQWDTMSRKYATYSSDVFSLRQKLSIQLDQRLIQLQTQEDLFDYEPHCYADEGEHETNQNLDPIPIPEIDFSPDIITNLDLRFKKLATVCRPDLSQFE
ncbi:desmocollin 2-like protein isoform X1 [Neoarius graeffei]|uniref:desmocollin 2-like protein isoform X1 n=1 Tax=Neoarius graeffei TaxID=443677 RepID=UPI00298D4BF1|nr:desmocollin 2-like protein isoform X1 [Neoarius graeffei]